MPGPEPAGSRMNLFDTPPAGQDGALSLPFLHCTLSQELWVWVDSETQVSLLVWEPGMNQRQLFSSVASSSAIHMPSTRPSGSVCRKEASWCGETAAGPPAMRSLAPHHLCLDCHPLPPTVVLSEPGIPVIQLEYHHVLVQRLRARDFTFQSCNFLKWPHS